MNPGDKKWLVFYTKSRWEKRVQENLNRAGFKVFLPTQVVYRQWSDRKKKVELPLFSSYIFVREHESQIQEIVKIPGVSWNIRHNGKPAVLRDSEFEMINRFIQSGYFLEAQAIDDLEVGDEVEVIDGPLRGAAGMLTAEDESKFAVLLDSLGHGIKVKIDKSLLRLR